MSDPTCAGMRELLGVYVVGAIDPAERAIVDAHLNHCHDCREELAGLAVLPALLHRVSLTDAERLLGADAAGDDDPAEPSHELLPSLLRRVASRRRSRRLRAALTAAAVTLALVGGTAAVSSVLGSSQSHRVVQDEAGIKTRRVDAMVRYGKPQWGPGTVMFVRVIGLPTWSKCKFWVVTKSGRRDLAGGWTVGPRGSRLWYPASIDVPKSTIIEFVLTTASGQMVTIPTD